MVEEKRSLIEVQVREELYGTANQPICIGKKDEQGNWLFPVKGALDPNDVAICIGERLLRYGANEELAARVAQPQGRAARARRDAGDRGAHAVFLLRLPAQFVDRGAGGHARLCRHRLPLHGAVDGPQHARLHPDGRRGRELDRRGAVLQRAATCSRISATAPTIIPAIWRSAPPSPSGVNITYKILFNDAVAMTGGQRNDGGLTVPQIARQVAAEGAKRIVVVTDEPHKYPQRREVAARADHPSPRRSDAGAGELAAIPGVTVLIYDQTCAAEKRRRRKRGAFPDPDKRVVINELVCEGCGDCGVKSNCVSVQPLETEFGRKRTHRPVELQQGLFLHRRVSARPSSRCEGAQAEERRGRRRAASLGALPEPADRRALERTYAIIITGIGGTGIVTIGAILGMAAHLEGKGVGVIDMAGLAQKGGAVYSHIRIAERAGGHPRHPRRRRRAPTWCSAATSSWPAQEGAGRDQAGRDRGGGQSAEFLPGDFTRNADFSLPTERLKRAIAAAAGARAARISSMRRGSPTRSLGNVDRRQHVHGRLRLSARRPAGVGGRRSSRRSSSTAKRWHEHAAFRWGRRAAVDPAAVESCAPRRRQPAIRRSLSQTLDEMVARRVAFLTDYQDARLCRALSSASSSRRARSRPPRRRATTGLAEAVAR